MLQRELYHLTEWEVIHLARSAGHPLTTIVCQSNLRQTVQLAHTHFNEAQHLAL